MKRTHLFSLFFTLIAGYNVLAQEKFVALAPFKATNPEYAQEAAVITSKIKQLFVEDGQFTVLDRSSITTTAIIDELEVQKNIEFIKGKLAEQGKQNGAEAIITGELSALSYSPTSSGTTSVGFSFSITISNVENGNVLASESFNKPYICPICSGTSKIESLTASLNFMQGKLKKFIIDNFPKVLEIASVDEVGRGGEVLIVGGEDEGLQRRSKLVIYQLVQRPFGIQKKEIVSFTIDRIEGDFSVGKINSRDLETLIKIWQEDKNSLQCQTQS